jgi:hypothetical protein
VGAIVPADRRILQLSLSGKVRQEIGAPTAMLELDDPKSTAAASSPKPSAVPRSELESVQLELSALSLGARDA